jgi:TRAP transporter T-component
MKFRALCLGFLFSACAAGPELPKSQQGKQGDLAQAQILFEKAEAAAKAANKLSDIEPVFKAYEEVLAIAPDHRDALVGAARFRFYFADAVLERSKDKDAVMASFLKGREHGLHALATNAEFRAAYEKDSDIQKQVALLKKDDAPALYWAALNWTKWGEMYGILRAAIDIPKVKAMMDRLNELEPTYNGNGADRFFAGYWVAIPGFSGRDANKAKAAYERAVQMSPQWLSNHVVYADYYAKDKEDRPLFESSLKRVIEAAPDQPETPSLIDNVVARDQAKKLLAQAKEIFE